MKETKQQQRHYKHLLTLYGDKPSLSISASKKTTLPNTVVPQLYIQKNTITKNLLQSTAIAGFLITLQYVVGILL